MRLVNAPRIILAILGLALLAAAAACALPDNPYQRWQLLDGTIHARARWIYERIHDDPTPIDVVFVGPSRTEKGINAGRLQSELAAQGLNDTVVNFAMAEAGRNLNYVIVRELLKSRTPKLLVLGVTEKPSRFGHPAFKYIATAGEILEPGYLTDLNYFSDLLYLPYRQIRLFAASWLPGGTGLARRFDPARYQGPSLDATGNEVLPDGRIKEGVKPASMHELLRGVHKLERGMHPPILPARYADLEFGDERHYVREICRMARAKGVKVAFLFLPYYTGPDSIQESKLYESCGPIWNEAYLAPHAELFADYGHLTKHGAEVATDWVEPKVAALLSGNLGAAPTGKEN